MDCIGSLTLRQAPTDEAYVHDVYRRVCEFLDRFVDPNVRARTKEEITVAAQGGRFYLVQEHPELAGFAAFYVSQSGAGEVGEFGTTIMQPQYQSFGTQCAIYKYSTAAEWLSGNWPRLGAYAIVHESALGSWKNIERCLFKRSLQVPPYLLKISARSRAEIGQGEKRLYLLGLDGVAAALEFVAENGPTTLLRSKTRNASMLIRCEFPVFKNFSREVAQELVAEAAKIRDAVAIEKSTSKD